MPLVKFKTLHATKLWLRVQWGVTAGLLIFLLFRFIEYLCKVHPNGFVELLGILVLTPPLVLLTDPFINFQVFALSKAETYELHKHWWKFVQRYDRCTPTTRAKLLFFLFATRGPDEPPELTLDVKLVDYMRLLCAATYFAQNEVSATYTFSISDWADIAQYAEDYSVALKETNLKKKRFVVAPLSSIEQLRADPNNELIVRNTHSEGADIAFVAEEVLKSRGVELARELEDYALFDGAIVITAGKIPGLSPTLGLATPPQPRYKEDTPMRVRLLKGEATKLHRFWMKEIKLTPPTLDIPLPSGSELQTRLAPTT